MDKILRLGAVNIGRFTPADVFVHVVFKDGRLSITGVVGPRNNGDARGSCGQIDPREYEYDCFAPGWNAEKVTRLATLWDRWHLNDMRAGCEHQRALDTSREVEIVSYKLTSEARRLRDQALAAATQAGLTGQPLNLNPTARALAELKDWFKDRFEPPDADSPLSGCYEVAKRETKRVGWVYPHEHPLGLLTKPCEVCGHKYGSAWLREDVPADVLAELEAFPSTDKTPAWV